MRSMDQLTNYSSKQKGRRQERKATRCDLSLSDRLLAKQRKRNRKGDPRGGKLSNCSPKPKGKNGHRFGSIIRLMVQLLSQTKKGKDGKERPPVQDQLVTKKDQKQERGSEMQLIGQVLSQTKREKTGN